MLGTVELLHWFIWERLQGQRPPAPKLQQVADFLYQWIGRHRGARRRRLFRSSSRLDQLISPECRATAWAELESHVGTLPELVLDPCSGSLRLPDTCCDVSNLAVFLFMHFSEKFAIKRSVETSALGFANAVD